jgi:hypothetical protein
MDFASTSIKERRKKIVGAGKRLQVIQERKY